MFIEVTTKNAAAKKKYMEKLIQTFVAEKMETLEAQAEDQNEEQDSLRTKYLASLWMIASVTGVMQQEEIAQQAGVSSSLLQRWEKDKMFNVLVEYNYQEFLIYIVNLFA
jgi:transcriptional regulator with XRE-family HTH domain